MLEDDIVPETQDAWSANDDNPEVEAEEEGRPPGGRPPSAPKLEEAHATATRIGESAPESGMTAPSLEENQEMSADGRGGHAATQKDHGTTAPETKEQLLSALTHSIQEHAMRKPRQQIWLDSMQQLFGLIYPKKSVALGGGETAPKGTKTELERLIDLFEHMVVTRQLEWTEWAQSVERTCHNLYQSKQSLESVISKEIGRVSVHDASVNTVVLTNWAQKVTGLTKDGSQGGSPSKTFLFKKGVNLTDEIRGLRAICENTYGKYTRPRCDNPQPRNDAFYKLPQFLNRIMRTEGNLRVIGTIRAQVEGLLVMSLKGEFPVKEAFQSTESLQENYSYRDDETRG
ncbi:hypothetical protein PHMEG_0001006 [Phytophthora megakarya]|uniref:Uncharacterized protein n=1 Tax=Phytophthora megakarya TaxID=4795 RepID=A0A225X1L7_9STRA|nr:hypothetical protein PHMEG_0001006 [Phytophthora megakarya]